MAKAEIMVNNKRYVVSCEDGQQDRLHKLGERLDRRVSNMADAMGDIGVERLFLAASLSLLDEMDALEDRAGVKSLEDRIVAIEANAAKALTQAAARIDAITTRVVKAS